VEAPQEGKEDVAVDGWSLRFSEGSSYAVGAFAGLSTSELHFFVKGVGDFIAPLSDGARPGGGPLARVSGLTRRCLAWFGTTGESRGRW